MNLRCDKILITGGGSGIGKAIAKRFLNSGAKVTIVGRKEEKLKKTVQEFSSNNLYYIVWDISDISAAPFQLKTAEKLMGGLNGFVNAAAVSSAVVTKRGYEPFDINEKEWDELNDINYKAAFFNLRNEIEFLRQNKIKGNILNIASNAACMDIVGSYGASKLSLIKWTRAFGKKFGKDGIIINGIAPGATFTPMIERYAKSIDQPYERHAIGRFIKPEEIAELAFYLMSDYGEIICGHTVVADGGDNMATL